MVSITCSKHLALPPCLVTFPLASNRWRAPPSVRLLSILAPSLPFFFLEGSGGTRSTSSDVFIRISLGIKAHLRAVTFILTIVKVQRSIPLGFQLGTMRACVPLIVAMLCSLTWAGKSLSDGAKKGFCIKKLRFGELGRG